jgi:hypothetical protein
LQCAKCHNHPFERWTQDNYYGLGASFNRVQRKKTQRPNEWLVFSSDTGEVVQPRTGQTMKPWVPGATDLTIDPAKDRRQAFVDWLVQSDNPFLARVEANRIWSHLFSRGIVDPIDDFRDSNPPTNRPLLDELTKRFVESGFNRRELIRTILQSRAYQSSYETNTWNEKDQLYFSHQKPRLLSAEQLLDAINQLTQTEQNYPGLPVGTKATQIPAPDIAKVDFLEVCTEIEALIEYFRFIHTPKARFCRRFFAVAHTGRMAQGGDAFHRLAENTDLIVARLAHPAISACGVFSILSTFQVSKKNTRDEDSRL